MADLSSSKCKLRRFGLGALVAVVLGLVASAGMDPAHASAAVDLVFHGPDLASGLLSPVSDATLLIAAPAGDSGFWGSVNGWIADALAAAVTALVAWACSAFTAHTGIQVTTAREAQIRETMKTGAYKAASELEIAIGDHVTPAQTQKVVSQMVAWVEQREAPLIAKLGLPGTVLFAMANKVLGQLVDGTADLVPSIVQNVTGNPGETPALDRAAGGAGGN